jgi:hypothetical protein
LDEPLILHEGGLYVTAQDTLEYLKRAGGLANFSFDVLIHAQQIFVALEHGKKNFVKLLLGKPEPRIAPPLFVVVNEGPYSQDFETIGNNDAFGLVYNLRSEEDEEDI